MLGLLARSSKIDHLNVAEEMRDAGQLEAIGGAAAIDELAGWVPAAGHAREYGRIIRENAQLRDLIRGPDPAAGEAYVEATIHEGMRNRPVIPMIVRLLRRPWRLGEYVLPAHTPVAVSIIALHHRPDVYPEPHAFRPERFLDENAAEDGPGAFVKPGTYTWIPLGGGIRRCLGATLAMAEQRVVVQAIARRTDLAAADSAPEAPRMRNVTMIPSRGGRIVVAGRWSA